MEEIFKDIPNYEGLYQAGSLGNIKSLKCGREKILKPSISGKGYWIVQFYSNGIRCTKRIHVLVAITFLNHKQNGLVMVVNHKDFNKLNNRVENLEIVTNRENLNKKHLPSSSKYTGVSWSKRDKRWKSEIYSNRKKIYLGMFVNEHDAHLAYENKLKEINRLI